MFNEEKYPIFDTHAHYDDVKFNDYPDIFSQIESNGVIGVINCAVNIATSKGALVMSQKNRKVWAAVGVHPENINDEPFNENTIFEFCQNEKAVAVGEIGLDYYWDKSNTKYQKEIFEKQVVLANRLEMPIIVHDREAHNDTLEILKKHKPKGVVHCFSGSREMAEKILKIGMYIGIGGASTFKNARKIIDVIKILPPDRILLETDSPYMTPEPMRGKINRSDYIYYIGKKIAEIKNVNPETIFNASIENTKRLFKKIII